MYSNDKKSSWERLRRTRIGGMNFLYLQISTNFRLELIEPSARDVDGHQFF